MTTRTGVAEGSPPVEVTLGDVGGKEDSSWRCPACDLEAERRRGCTQTALSRDLCCPLGAGNWECSPYCGCCAVVWKVSRATGADVTCERQDCVAKTLDLGCLWSSCMQWISILGNCIFRLDSLHVVIFLWHVPWTGFVPGWLSDAWAPPSPPRWQPVSTWEHFHHKFKGLWHSERCSPWGPVFTLGVTGRVGWEDKGIV